VTAPPGAVVLGANLRALGIVRSLGRRGIATVQLAEPGDQVASLSRYAGEVLPMPPGDARARTRALLVLAERRGLQGWALFPTDDEHVALVAHAHDELAERFTLTSPPWETFRHAYDKRLTHRLAERAGVGHPWTRWPRTLGQVETLPCPFPAILKPAVKPEENPFTHDKAWRVDDRRALVERWAQAAALVSADAVMVQELVPGDGEAQFSFAALCRDGDPLASLVARRTRQYPRDFGHSSSLVETVADPAVEACGRAVVGTLAWTGLVEVEMKRDARDGELKLLDVNGRVWTWHALGPRAGVDFPHLAWRLARGLAVDRVRARPGVRWVRFGTDVPSAMGAIGAGELTPAAWAASLRPPLEPALLDLDDPMPALLGPPVAAWRVLRRRVRLRRVAHRPARVVPAP
jgi:predicted ATP-grasp superfamily ATP-dependent carboligase